MDQQLIDFISNYLTLAGYRNVAPDTPIKFEIQPERSHPNRLFIVVVSFFEPTFSQLPYNVIWLPADPEHPAYQKALKRISHADTGFYKNSWEEIQAYADLWTPDQYYSPVVEDPRLHGITTDAEPTGPAARNKHGLVVLSAEEAESRVVSIEDPRNSDDRYPTFHTHPDYPRTKIKINANDYALVSTSAPPQQGMMLFIIGQSESNPNEWIAIWKFPTEDDMVEIDRSLIGISINGPTNVPEQDSAVFTVTAYYADGTTAQVQPNSFTTSNTSISSINVQGDFTTNNVTSNTQVVLSASYTEDGITVTDTHNVQVSVGLEVVGLEIVGDNAIDENTTFQYVVRATFNDNSTQDVIADSITSSQTNYATINGTALLTAKEVNGGDKTTVLDASYTYDGVEVTASKTVTILDTDPLIQSLEIIGPTSLAEGESANYTVKLVYDDGSEVVPFTPDSFAQSSNAYSTLNGQELTAGSINQDRSVRLTAEFTEYGNTVRANLDVALINNPPAPISAVIVGANSVNEQTTSQYRLRVTYDDSSTQDFTNDPTWSITAGNTYGSIASSGVLTANDVDSDQQVTISASHEIQGQTMSATKDVDIIAAALVPVSLEVSTDSGTEYTEGQTAIITYVVTYSDNSTANVKTSPSLSRSFVGNAYGSTFTGVNNNDVLLGDVTGNKVVTIRGTYTENGTTVQDTLALNVADSDVSPRYGVAPIQDYRADYASPAFYDLLTDSNPLGGGELTGTSGEEITVGPLNDNNEEQGFILYPKDWGYLYIVNTGNNQAGSWDMGKHSLNDGEFGSPAEINIGGTDYYVYRTDFAFGPAATFSITYGSGSAASGEA